MPIPIINDITGLFVLEKDKLMLPYTPYATNSPTSWACSGLPTGVSINTTTGVISGTPTVAGRVTASLTATNGSGASLPLSLFLTVLPAPPADDEGLIDLNFDLQTGQVWNPSITEGPITYGKDSDILGFAIAMVRATVMRTMTITNIKVSLRDNYDKPLATLFNAAPAAPLNAAAPRYRVIFDLAATNNLAAVIAALGDHENDSKLTPPLTDNELAAKCDIEFTYTVTTIGGVTSVVRTSKTFSFHLAKAIETE